MLIRTFVIASLVLAAMGLTVTVATVVIGQEQPGSVETGAGFAPAATPGTRKSPAKTPRIGGGQMSGMGMPGGGMYGDMKPGTGGSGGMMGPVVPEDELLETWVSRALADYAQTEDQAARNNQRGEISKALDRIFDIRQERRMAELETLEQRIQNLRGTLEAREKQRSDILKSRLDYLIREADGLGWGDGLPALGRSAPTGFNAGGSSHSWDTESSGGFGTGGGPPASGAGSEADRK